MTNKTALAVKSRKPLKARLWDQRYLFLLMIPGVIWVLVICYAPMTGLYMAFTNYRPSQNGYFYDLFNGKFVGLQWFQYFFTKDFSMIMRNTLATSFLTLLFSFPAPIILALMLNELRSLKLKKFIQTASYLPYFISWVIASNIFLTFLSGNGLVNDILIGLGLIDQRILFFQNGPYFWWIIAIANTWKAMGYNAIIYLSAISGIDQQLYEAAEVDGANRVKRIWHITLPTIRPTISILLILAIGGILSTGFEQQLLMGNNAILNYSDVLDTYSYRYGLAKGMYSYGTAVGLFKSVVSFILVMSANRITAKLNDSALF
ncbi:MAG: sugar ABC transporter permease [Clostridia bacterium]|nr:sugar ABC transporter permease [Clostridia bacterium]